MQKEYKSLRVTSTSDILNIQLNRPQKGNSLNMEMVEELLDILELVENRPDIRFIVISSGSKVFCAGADLEWMAEAPYLAFDKNLDECRLLASVFHNIHNSGKIVIASINGACIGGGVGLAAASDFVVASHASYFLLSEVRIGLVSAVITPFIVGRTGVHVAKTIMLKAEKMNASRAFELKLVDVLTSSENIDSKVNELIHDLRAGEKNAQQIIKQLMSKYPTYANSGNLLNLTAEILAKARISAQAHEGITAFFEKRKPKWANNNAAE